MAVLNRLRRLVDLMHTRRRIAVIVTLAVVAGLFWVLPRQTQYVVPVAGNNEWPVEQSPPTREIVWQSPAQITWGATPEQERTHAASGPAATPRFASHGTVLYFTLQNSSGQADIWESRMVEGAWTAPQPLPVINSTANEFGPMLDRQEKHLYFYSDRSGGLGGFDIYVARRSEQGTWQTPVNLGPQINSAADEYDPAVSPDHTQLFFASDRIERLGSPRNHQQHKSAWTVTIRVRRQAATFDLFRASRTKTTDAWHHAERLESINQPLVNDGAPFVSPNGAFLYFASDRRARPQEDTNLDLYRARITGDTLETPENLGPSLNTAAHETEPGLSAQGFTLVFASDRDGQDRLFLSHAEEIVRVDRWDTSHLSGWGRLWWQSLLVTALIMGIIAVVALYRGHLWERAYASRFFIGSVVVHAVVLLILAAWTLPKVVEMIVAEVKQSDPVSDSLLESERQSHADGRESYEKVADLDAPVQDVPDQVRQVTQSNSIPLATTKPLLALPMPRNRPTANIRPQPQTVSVSNTPPELRPLTRRTAGPDTQRLVADNESPVPLPKPAEVAHETPIDPRVVSLPRHDVPLEPTPTAVTPSVSPAPRIARPRQIVAAPPTDVPATELAVSSPQRRAVAIEKRLPALNPESVELPPREATPTTEPVATSTPVSRQTTTQPVPTPVASRDLPRRQRSPQALAVAASPLPAAPDARLREASDNPLTRRLSPPPTRGIPNLEETLPELPITKSTPNALQVKAQSTRVPRIAIRVPQPGTAPEATIENQPLTPTQLDRNTLTRTVVDSEMQTPPSAPLPVTRQPLVMTGPNLAKSLLDEPTPQIAPAQTRPQLSKLPLAENLNPQRASSQIAETPRRPPSLPAQQIPAGPRRVQTRRSAIPLIATSQPGLPATPVSRAATAAAQVSVRRLTDQPSLSTLTTGPTTAESPIPSIEISPPRQQLEQIVPEIPDSSDAGGPFQKRKTPIIGSLAERKHDAPPSFGPLVSLLNRRPARAPRVAFAQDKVGLKSLLVLRQGNVRREYIEILGGNDETEHAVDLGLKWLADHQDTAGNWSLNNFHKNCKGKHANCGHPGSVQSDTAATGFALLPFLAAGHTHQQGDYRKQVAAAAKWLVNHQQQNGDLFVPGNKHHWMYSHGVASMALCELYGMSGDEDLKQP
ncbi:MAG: hypothetical protein ABGZ17_11240, partial [Planctomycetaceae bacterium]